MNLQQAIIKVMTTQYKKDAKEAHQIVEAAGYTITKNNGHYYIRNEKTHRHCCIIYCGVCRQGFRYVVEWGSMGYGSKAFYVGYDNKISSIEWIPFDFVAMLNKPYNKEPYYDNVWNKSVAKERYNTIRSTRNTLQYKNEEIDKCLKEMNWLQKHLIELTEDKCKWETRLNEYLEEYGLKEIR